MLTDAQQIEAERIIELFGDAVSDMFEQLERGNWVDDHGHSVQRNSKMLALIPVVERAIKHRADVGLANVCVEEWAGA